MPLRARPGFGASLAIGCLALLLAACHSGGGRPRSQQPTVGAAGGTVAGPSGSQVVIPANALSANTSIAIARSSAGAPQLPTGFITASDVFELTPHGTRFTTPVTVTIPFDPNRINAGFMARVYKTNAANVWERQAVPSISASTASVQVSSFSHIVVGLLPPQITRGPQSVSVGEGDSVEFAVATAESDTPLSFQWQRSADGVAPFIDIPVAIGSSHQLETVAASDDGAQFRVIVSNADGSVASEAAILTVQADIERPEITSQPQDRTVVAGANVTFSVTASGGALEYQWERANGPAATFNSITGATAAEYTLANAQNADNDARFRVRVANAAGSAVSRAAVLTVGAVVPVSGRRIGGGSGFSVARLANGELRSWGRDSGAELGNGPTAGDRLVPGPVEDISDAVDIAVGLSHTVAILESGELRGWGFTSSGELGYPGRDPVQTPEAIPGIPTATAVCAGSQHSLYLLPDGTVLATGRSVFGALGNGTFDPQFVPVAVSGLQNVIAIECSANSSFALLSDRTLRAWGANASGELGIGDGGPVNRNTPQVVSGLDNVIAVSSGGDHTLALRADGSVWAWGDNTLGTLGTGSPSSGSTVPVPTLASSRIIAISAGFNYSLALRDDGRVLVWGSNDNGELASGAVRDPILSATPRLVNGLPVVVEIDATLGSHPMVLGVDGTVWSWASNENGEMGNGTQGLDRVTTPTQVGGLDLD